MINVSRDIYLEIILVTLREKRESFEMDSQQSSTWIQKSMLFSIYPNKMKSSIKVWIWIIIHDFKIIQLRELPSQNPLYIFFIWINAVGVRTQQNIRAIGQPYTLQH